jgi:hypothetical protein
MAMAISICRSLEDLTFWHVLAFWDWPLVDALFSSSVFAFACYMFISSGPAG